MGLAQRLLGYVSAPFVGARFDRDDYKQAGFSASEDGDELPKSHFGYPVSQQMVPMERIVNPFGSLSDRSNGTYSLIPGRALSAQTRLKNMTWELPAAVWTENPEGPGYILRVPGLPHMVQSLTTVNNFTTQPEFLQPITNLQIQNDINWINQFRAAIFGTAAQQQIQQQTQNQQTMFPSIFGGDISVPTDFSSGGE